VYKKKTEIIAIKEQSERGNQHQNPSGLEPPKTPPLPLAAGDAEEFSIKSLKVRI